uniref:HlyD family secretion protein n=1 Tax=Desulfosarcina cetonica TaxID=90730 RepID=UPI000AA1736C
AIARQANATAAIDAVKARIDEIQSFIDDSTLTAPVDGRVLYRLAEPGEVLGAGGRVLTLLDVSDVTMTIFLPTDQAGRVDLGSDARIVLDALPDVVIPARVSFVAPKAQFTPKDVETRTEREKLMFRVKVRIDPELLRPMPRRSRPVFRVWRMCALTPMRSGRRPLRPPWERADRWMPSPGWRRSATTMAGPSPWTRSIWKFPTAAWWDSSARTVWANRPFWGSWPGHVGFKVAR